MQLRNTKKNFVDVAVYLRTAKDNPRIQLI